MSEPTPSDPTGNDSMFTEENAVPAEAWRRNVSAMFGEIAGVAGFSPPRTTSDGFFALHKDLIETVPSEFAHLIPAEPGESDWLARFRHAVLTSVQEGLYASQYHLHRVEGIENEILAIAKRHVPTLGMPLGSAAGGGNTRALNCEYQAFAFATRRTLEYLGVAAAAFFKTDCHSIKKLRRAIKDREPRAKSDALQKLLADKLASIGDLLPEDKHNNRSLRDKLAHWESISAGTFNVSRSLRGFSVTVVGGGHNLVHFQSGVSDANSVASDAIAVSVALGPALRDQYKRMEQLVTEVLASLGLHIAL